MKNKNTFKDLPVILNTEELLSISKEITDMTLDIDSIENQKKRISPLRDEITILSKKFHNGYEIKSVHCRVEFNEPTIGKKSIIRSDTDQLIEILNMTAEEMQEDFNFESEPKQLEEFQEVNDG
jgi:hypothetical protein